VGFLMCAGCCSGPPAVNPPANVPTELAKTMHPEYVIAPPDVLLINVLRATPKPPYHIKTEDVLAINVSGTIPDQPIAGLFIVQPDGRVNLGYSYGTVEVVDKTIEEGEAAITKQLRLSLKAGFQVSVSLAQSRALQQIRGEHLVRPDGTIGLGVYGNLRVTGLTLSSAKLAIESHLSEYLVKPEVAVDVSGFNSQVYYVIAERPGLGELVFRFPVTGNETVVDAIAQIYGLPAAASKKRIWVSRPTPANASCDEILPVDWVGITEHGQTATNYQLMPGDRVYLRSQGIINFDVQLAKILSPVERVLGVTLLGSTTIHSIAIPLGQSTAGAGF
jgi:polysaccharide export outer membrane protein